MTSRSNKLVELLDHYDTPLGIAPTTKGRRRKQKKHNQKEILNQLFDDRSDDDIGISGGDNKCAQFTRSTYIHYDHLSEKEKSLFDDKFHKPKNDSQAEYSRLLVNKNKKIVVANGPAGTGKTMFATEYGIRFFLTGVYEKLIFTRPSVSVDENLGFLPGSVDEKMTPWVRPIYDILYQFLSYYEVNRLMDEKIIEIAPLGYMRGRTFENAYIVADEMQNSTVSQMKMLLTRLGANSRLIITGDLDQHDQPVGLNGLNGLEDFLQRFKGKRSSSISSFEFDRSDIQREEVVKEVLEIYGGEMAPDYSSVSEDNSQPEVNSQPEDNSSI
jgi:phosphate starvation-inducible PhoH-like protein